MCSALLTLLASVGILAVEAPPESAVGSGVTTMPAASQPALSNSVVRVAFSSDGKKFKETGTIVMRNGTSPDLVCLANGHLLALCDVAIDSVSAATGLVASQSTDGGRTWTPAKPIKVADVDARRICARHGAFALMPDGSLRLYFLAGLPRDDKTGASTASQPFDGLLILSFVTRDGVFYKLDRKMGLSLDSTVDVGLATMTTRDGSVHLFVNDDPGRSGTKADQPRTIRHLVSKDGRDFESASPVSVDEGCSVGSIVCVGKILRAYVSKGNGIRSIVSVDGVRWKAEKGIRLAGGRDPAVVRLKNGSYVMLYCVKASRESSDSSVGAMTGDAPDAGSQQGYTDIFVEGVDDGSEAGYDETSDAFEDDYVGDVEITMPPRPDFLNPVDYVSWLQQYFPGEAENNAQDAYDALIPDDLYSGGKEPDWGPHTFNDLYYYSGINGPWTPEDNPDLESWHQLLQGSLSEFRDATLLENYATPYHFDEAASNPDDGPLLVNVLLPSLGGCRTMVKATLADAWRAEGGRVDPERMTEAWETCLRNSQHLRNGFTLLEHLVSIADQGLVQEDARLALKHGVFQTADEIERALDVFKQYDRRGMDEPTWVMGEAAMAMEATQWLFAPLVNGEPQININRAERFLGTFEGPNVQVSQEKIDRYAQMGPEDAYTTIDVIEQHYSQLAELWRVGYPEVRSSDIGSIEVGQKTEITKMMLPSLARAYQIAARNETSRRATRLTYEVHLFKVRQGRWPSSLDELPLQAGDKTRTDPFTGGDFGYQLTETGPTIYSLSENARDDGGVHSRNWDDRVESDAESDDYVFWPPQ